MVTRTSRTTADSLAASSYKIGYVEAQVHAAISSWRISPEQRKRLYAVMGRKGKTSKPTLADFKARDKLTRLLIKAMKRHWRQHRDQHHYVFISIIHSIGNTTDNRPEVALDAFKAMARKAIAQLGVSAIGMIEAQGIMNYPGGMLGRTLMFHGHFVGFARDVSHIQDAVDTLNASRAWHTTFGALPIDVSVLDDVAGIVEWMAHYFSKMPNDAKNLMPHNGKPGRVRMMNTTIGYRPEFALRIYEGLSQIPITDAIFGVGAKSLLNPVRKKLLAWHKRRSGPTLPNSAVPKLWRQLRAVNGSRRFLPYKFLTGSERPTPLNQPVIVERKVRSGNRVQTRKTTAMQRLLGARRGRCNLDDL